jgi:glycosyltransferase involved in cell wall biosynthesis
MHQIVDARIARNVSVSESTSIIEIKGNEMKSTEESDRRPLVSICIPNFNYGKYISEAIDSVLNQSLKEFELVIVDDCSTDNSKEVISRYSDSRIRFYENETNIGMTKNWNKCVKLSRGEFICILGADDYVHPEFLEKSVHTFRSNSRVGLVYSASEKVKDNREKIEVFRMSDIDFIESGSKAFRRFAERNVVMPSSALIRKDCFESLGYFDEHLGYAPDIEMFARIATRYDVAYISEVLGYYRLHKENFTKVVGKRGEMVEEIIMTIDKMISDIPDNSDLVDIRQNVNRMKAKHILGAMYVWALYDDLKSTRKNILKILSLDRHRIFDLRVIGVFLLSFLGRKATTLIIQKIWLAKYAFS